MPLLMWLFIVPFITAVLVVILPQFLQKYLKGIAAVLSLIPLAILLYGYDSLIGSKIDYDWIPALSVRFQLSIDTISLLFLFLTAIITPISILAIRSGSFEQSNILYGLILLLQGLLIGFFTAADLAVFTVFWEGMLLPLYFIISIWGGEKRQSAALKFLIYMIAGSALMVAAVLGLYFSYASGGAGGSFNMEALKNVASHAHYANWIFAAFLLAFAVKTPLFPFHAWLPDAYCQAPTSGTILLSAILSKAGIYGILRIGMGFFPALLMEWSPLLLGLAIAGVFYGGLAAWTQKDFKRLIAYSSFSHVNFILAGLFIWNDVAQAGGILQALNHGITIAALFLTAGWLQERIGTSAIGTYSGLAKYFPQLCWLTLFFVLSSVALPGMNNFVGELMIFFGLFGQDPWLTAFLGLSIILSVIYMLRFMQKIYFEKPSVYQQAWTDITAKEFAVAAPLVLLILWIGIYPAPLIKQIMPAAKKVEAIAKLEHQS